MPIEVTLPKFIKLTENSENYGATIFDNATKKLQMYCDSHSAGVSNSLHHSILLDAVIMLHQACTVMVPYERFQPVLYVHHEGEFYFTKDYMYTNITM